MSEQGVKIQNKISPFSPEAGINFTWPSALRRVTRHIKELALLLTRRACVWWGGNSDEISALAAFPISQTALGADVSGEFSLSGETALSALIFIRFVIHSLHLHSFSSL